MADSPVYCIDTSAILEGRRRAYSPDVFVRLWESIEVLIAEGRLVAPEEVRIELSAKDDETYAWARRQERFFIPLDIDQARETRLIADRFPEFVDNPKSRNRADPFVIALAKVRGYRVVPQERPGSPDNPKMPTVCDHFRVPYLRFLDMVRAERWTF